MECKKAGKSPVIRLLEDFCIAGTSALLIAFSHLQSEFWYVSLFALIPFLRRLSQSSLLESIVLSSLLAASYSFAMLPHYITPGVEFFIPRLICLVILFSLYGVTVNRIVKNVGFNVILIAASWMPIEYALSHYAHMGNILIYSAEGSRLLFHLSSLFGVLMISFLIVLINSIVLIASGRLIRSSCTKPIRPADSDKKIYPAHKESIFEGNWHLTADARAPPYYSSVPA